MNDDTHTDEDVIRAHSPVPVTLAASLISTGLVLYRRKTGEITQVMRASPETVEKMTSEEIGLCEIPGDPVEIHGFAGFSYAVNHYVETRGLYPMIREKPACPAVLDGRTLRNLPVPCTIEITAPGDEARFYDEDEATTLAIDFDHADEYTITVRAMRCLPGVYHLDLKEPTNGQ